MSSGVGLMLAAGTATRSAHPPSMASAVTRCPALNSDSYGADRTTPATSVPGMNGGSSRIWYSPRSSSRSGKLTPVAPTSTTTEACSPPPTASSTSVYTSPAGPDSSRATSAFMRRRSAEAERGPLRRRKVGDLAPLGGHIVDRRHAIGERHAVVLKERCPLHFA